MFGLSLEKLVVLALIAAFVLGPHRLPQYAQRLAEIVRTLRDLLETTRERTRAELGAELGAALSADEWRGLDPRRYDPRSIIRDALATGDAHSPAPGTSPAPTARARFTASASPSAATALTSTAATPPSAPHAEVDPPLPPDRPRPRYDSAGRVIRAPA